MKPFIVKIRTYWSWVTTLSWSMRLRDPWKGAMIRGTINSLRLTRILRPCLIWKRRKWTCPHIGGIKKSISLEKSDHSLGLNKRERQSCISIVKRICHISIWEITWNAWFFNLLIGVFYSIYLLESFFQSIYCSHSNFLFNHHLLY